MSIQSYIKNNLFIVLSCALLAVIVISRKATPYFIGFWFIGAIFESFQNKEYSFKANLKWGSLIASLFIVYLIAFLFSDFTREASKALEIKTSFLVIPLAFFLRRKPIEKKELEKILFFFQTACFLSAIYLITKMVPIIAANSSSITPNGFTYWIRSFAESKLGIHPTYLSIFYLFSIYSVIKEKNGLNVFNELKGGKIIRVLHLICLSAIVLMLIARGPILGFFIAFILIEFLNNWKKGITISIIGLVGFIAIIFIVPTIGNRFKEAINSSEVTEDENSVNSSSIRRSILICSKQVIADNWIIGVGLDHVQSKLNYCYDSFENNELSKNSYNSHNQYFDIVISVGVIGLIIFFTIIIYPFTNRKSYSDHLFLFFKLFISVCFLTENLLSRQHGVVFFVLLNCLFISNHLNQKAIKKD